MPPKKHNATVSFKEDVADTSNANDLDKLIAEYCAHDVLHMGTKQTVNQVSIKK